MAREIEFLGYQSLAAGSGDPVRAKWETVRHELGLEWTPVGLGIDDIAEMNREVNAKIKYRVDADDVWQTPHKTETFLAGDCEDYAILKYGLLLKSGMVEDDLRLCVGRIATLNPGNSDHAWCAVFVDHWWRVLDNKFDDVIRPEGYINWVPAAAMHADKVTRYGKRFTLNEVMNSHKV